MYSVLILYPFFWFASINRKCICKIQFFFKFLVLYEGSSIIASLVEHPVYNIFKMQSVLSWFWLFYFDLLIFTKSVCIKGIFYCGLFLRILDQHWLLKFHILYSFLLKISLAPPRKKRCYFSHGPPCTLYFQGIVCPKPCFLILIWHSLIWHKILCLKLIYKFKLLP